MGQPPVEITAGADEHDARTRNQIVKIQGRIEHNMSTPELA